MKQKKTKNLMLINLFINFAGKFQIEKVVKASKKTKKVSIQTLRSILENAKDSEFGKKYDFEQILLSSDKELVSLYQEKVPVMDNSKKVVPDLDSEAYFQNVTSKMNIVWLYSFFMHSKKAFSGPMVCIFEEKVCRKVLPEFANTIFSVPKEVYEIEDSAARYYTLLRIALEQNVKIFICENPIHIEEMIKKINDDFETFCDDIEHGTLNKALNISSDIRAKLMPCFVSNPERAKELRKAKSRYETILPKHFWPELAIYTSWKCGNASVYLEKLREAFPKSAIFQDYSYNTKICRPGLVLNAGDDTLLFNHMHYFEFVEEGTKEFKQINELEVGKKYSIFVTTYSGLYRYNLGDYVEVSGYYNNSPTIKFAEKITK